MNHTDLSIKEIKNSNDILLFNEKIFPVYRVCYDNFSCIEYGFYCIQYKKDIYN